MGSISQLQPHASDSSSRLVWKARAIAKALEVSCRTRRSSAARDSDGLKNSGANMQVRKLKLAQVYELSTRLAGDAQQLASDSNGEADLVQSRHPSHPGNGQPDPKDQSPVEDRSWLSSALNKPEQLQRWSAKTPCPSLPPIQASQPTPESDEDPIQSAERAWTVSQHVPISSKPCLRAEVQSMKKAPGWRTAVHRLGLGSHRHHARQVKAQTDLISPWHGSDGQLSSKSPPKQPEEALLAPESPVAEAGGPQQMTMLDGVQPEAPASEPDMRKRRSAAPRALRAAEDDQRNPAADPIDGDNKSQEAHM